MGSEKETRHIELDLEDGMTYIPGDAVGILPENRREQVDEVLGALKMTGAERVLDHYKVEIDLDEALRTRLQIGKLARGSVTQMAKLAPDHEGLKAMVGAENKARAEEYCWGREFVDLLDDFPGVVTAPQQLFNILSRLTPRMYSIASSQAMHADNVQTTVRVVRYESHGRERQGVASGHMGDRGAGGVDVSDLSPWQCELPAAGGYDGAGDHDRAGDGDCAVSGVSGGAAGDRAAGRQTGSSLGSSDGRWTTCTRSSSRGCTGMGC